MKQLKMLGRNIRAIHFIMLTALVKLFFSLLNPIDMEMGMHTMPESVQIRKTAAFGSSVSQTQYKTTMSELLASCINLVESSGQRMVAAMEAARTHPENVTVALEALNIDVDLWRDYDNMISDEISGGNLWKAALFSSQMLIKNGISAVYPDVKVNTDAFDEKAAQNFLIPSYPVQPPQGLERITSVLEYDSQHEMDITGASVWLDGLDGMKEFSVALVNSDKSELLPAVTVQLCIVIDGKSQAAVIHQPFLNRTEWVYGNYSTLQTSTSSYRKNTIVTSTTKVSHLQGFATQMQSTLIGADGSGNKALMLLDGVADWYMQKQTMPLMELCPANAFLSSLGQGGGVIDWEGKPWVYRNDVHADEKITKPFIAARTEDDLQKALRIIKAEKVS